MTNNYFGNLVKFEGSLNNFKSKFLDVSKYADGGLAYVKITDVDTSKFIGKQDNSWVIKDSSFENALHVSKYMVYANGMLMTVADQDEFVALQLQVNTISAKGFLAIVSVDASTTPLDVSWKNAEGNVIIGNVAADVSTVHVMYLVPLDASTKNNDYAEYITTKKNDNYIWERIGTTSIDLLYYVKKLTINSSDYVVTSDNKINLGDLVTSVDSSIKEYGSGFIKITIDSSKLNGKYKEILVPELKVISSSDAIENVTDTSDALITAKAVKDYVDTKTQSISKTELDASTITEADSSSNFILVKNVGTGNDKHYYIDAKITIDGSTKSTCLATDGYVKDWFRWEEIVAEEDDK